MSDFIRYDAEKYPSEVKGMYGEFGSGSKVKVRYLQIVLQPSELKNIDLISDIKGSEKWPVRELFQRIVDVDRVHDDIIPYLENKDVVRFFNPISLIALPIDKEGNSNSVIRDLPALKEKKTDNDGTSCFFEHADFYQLERMGKIQASFKWNPINTKIVAIDGQHRLSAMKELIEKPKGDADIHAWIIPAVLIVMGRGESEDKEADLLDLIRKTFIYINTQAIAVNETRNILLDDEKPSNIFTQEFLQLLHSNDIKSQEDRDSSLPPLLMIDWRGETRNGKIISMPTSLFSVVEIKNWIEEYLLGEDFSDDQKEEISYDDFIPPLSSYGKKSKLNSNDADEIRKRFKDDILSGIITFFKGIKPFESYISALRGLEQKFETETRGSYSEYALNKLRFGYSNYNSNKKDGVEKASMLLVSEIANEKGQLPNLLKLDIGRRALFYAFGKLKKCIVKHKLDKNEARPSWLDVSTELLPSFNKVISDGWFDVDPSNASGSGNLREKIMELIAFDTSGTIINYRLDKAQGGFGSLLALLVAKELVEAETITKFECRELWYEEEPDLSKGIVREAKKMWKIKLKSDFSGTLEEFTAEINKQANKTWKKKESELKRKLGI